MGRSQFMMAEQEGEAAARFVVQEHHAKRPRWTSGWSTRGVLASWALPRGVPATPEEHFPAARTEDHPLEYVMPEEGLEPSTRGL
jgi:bifunctional non-homologous end joining protein LigD